MRRAWSGRSSPRWHSSSCSASSSSDGPRHRSCPSSTFSFPAWRKAGVYIYQLACFKIAFSTCAINPLIYAARMPEFRSAFIRCFHEICGCNCCTNRTSTLLENENKFSSSTSICMKTVWVYLIVEEYCMDEDFMFETWEFLKSHVSSPPPPNFFLILISMMRKKEQWRRQGPYDFFLLVSSAVGHGHDSTPSPFSFFFEKFLKSEKKCVGVPSPPPPLPAERLFQGWRKILWLAQQ